MITNKSCGKKPYITPILCLLHIDSGPLIAYSSSNGIEPMNVIELEEHPSESYNKLNGMPIWEL